MRVLFIRLSSFGDIVFAMPAARALRTALPEATLAWAVEGPLAPLVRGASYVDRVFVADTRIWRRSLFSAATRSEISSLLLAVEEWAPDLVVDAQGLFKSAWLTALVPADRKVGFGFGTATERIACLAAREWVEANDRPHVADRALALAEYVTGKEGFSRIPDVAHLVERGSPEVDAWIGSRHGRPFAMVQPFASRRDKEWAREPLAALARRLVADGIDTVVRWGPGERERAEAMAGGSGGLLTLAPATGPDTTARLARAATLVVGADTGPTHLAAATGTSTVALFGPTDPAVFGPLGARTAVVRSGSYNERGDERGDGGLPISAEDVYEAARSLLG